MVIITKYHSCLLLVELKWIGYLLAPNAIYYEKYIGSVLFTLDCVSNTVVMDYCSLVIQKQKWEYDLIKIKTAPEIASEDLYKEEPLLLHSSGLKHWCLFMAIFELAR